MFQGYLAWSTSSGADDEAVPRRFDDRCRDQMTVIDAENPLDLSREPSEQSEVSSRHPDKARYDPREELFVRKCNAGRRPFLFEQFLHLSGIKRSEFMDKSNARIKLRKAGDALLDTGHPNEDHAGAPLVKD
jgi:hypothetical protein